MQDSRPFLEGQNPYPNLPNSLETSALLAYITLGWATALLLKLATTACLQNSAG
jgi:hypothetical protein